MFKIKFFAGLIVLVVSALPAFSQSNGSSKIDEFGSVNCEDYLARMDTIIIQALNNPTARVFVFVYEGKIQRYKYKRDGSYTTESVLPQYGLAKAKIRSMKKYVQLKHFSTERFVFVKAGFREDFTVEIWLSPADVEQPKPTPTLTKMKYRKGKPAGFCIGCCGP
jgi:hypothetical protein